MDEDRIADAEQGGRPRHGRRTLTLALAMWPGPATAPRPTQCRSSQLPTNPNSCRSGRGANRRISGGFTVEANLGQPLPSAHARQRDPDLTGGPSISVNRSGRRTGGGGRIVSALAVPAAGSVVLLLLVVGSALYLTLFAPGARLADVRAEARDPELARLRGRSPLVLVPIVNPASAASLSSTSRPRCAHPAPAASCCSPSSGRKMRSSI